MTIRYFNRLAWTHARGRVLRWSDLMTFGDILRQYVSLCLLTMYFDGVSTGSTGSGGFTSSLVRILGMGLNTFFFCM